jgi:hypothetical protein
MTATCIVCSQVKTVCCDEGNDAVTSESPRCVDCCPSLQLPAIWEGKGVAGGVYERG